MANFCYDCTKDVLGVDPTWNDFARGRIRAIPEDEFWQVLCEGCGVVVVDSNGKKVDDMLLKFSPRIDKPDEEEI